jgi:hypothetical protein
VKKFLGEQRVPYTNVDIESDAEAMAYVEKVNNGQRIIPTMVFPTRIRPKIKKNPAQPGFRLVYGLDVLFRPVLNFSL